MWWTYLVCVIWSDVTNDSALPVVVILACATASVQPLPNSHDPTALRTANCMWSPPSITISLSPPIVSGYLYCICLGKAYRGWSNSITAACPGLRCSTALIRTTINIAPILFSAKHITTVMACLIMALEWAASAKRGSNKLWHRVLTFFCHSLWKADHDTIDVVFLQGAFPFPACLQQWVAYPLCLSVGGLLHTASYVWAIHSPSLWPEIVLHHHHLHYTAYLALLNHLVVTWQRGMLM